MNQLLAATCMGACCQQVKKRCERKQWYKKALRCRRKVLSVYECGYVSACVGMEIKRIIHKGAATENKSGKEWKGSVITYWRQMNGIPAARPELLYWQWLKQHPKPPATNMPLICH